MIQATPQHVQRLHLLSHPAASPQGRIFCFPHAGGDPRRFRAWSRYVPAGIEQWAICYPGRGIRSRERPLSDFGALIEDTVIGLRALIQDTTPFVFFGHSFGARLCFEVARQLLREQLRLPLFIMISACLAPDYPVPLPPLSILPDDQLLSETGGRFGGQGVEGLSPLLKRYFLRYYRTDLKAHDMYRFTMDATLPLPCGMTVIGGRQDWTVPLEALAQWKRFTHEPFTCQSFEGGHFFLWDHHVINWVLEHVGQWLLANLPDS